MTETYSQGPERPISTQGMTSEAGFQYEQERLGQLWTFLGYLQDVPNLNDWFTATLGGRSVFVQRFAEGLRGFENVCAHRFYPIRREERGNGPVVCKFHLWRYNQDGLAVGVPRCQQMFGKSPRELNAQLKPVEIDVCGSLIFGRFGSGPSLREWLGDGADIIGYLTAGQSRGGVIDMPVASHWKTIYALSMEEYHIVAVHPTTLGKDGYDTREGITRYYRFGAHSAFFTKGGDDALDVMARECREGRYHPDGYRVLQFFPTLFIVQVRAYANRGDAYWYLLVAQLVPEAHDRTNLRMRFFPMPFERPAGPLRKLSRWLAKPFLWLGMHYYIRKIMGEDNRFSEHLQEMARQIDGEPLLGRQEERVGWLEEEYAKVMTEPLPK